jgi:hypothetical protein
LRLAVVAACERSGEPAQHTIMDYQTDRIDEQSYFWVLFKPERAELFEIWEDVRSEYEILEFSNLREMTYLMESLSPIEFHGDPIEIFICRRIWKDKVRRDYIIDPDLRRYIDRTPAMKWLLQIDPRLTYPDLN